MRKCFNILVDMDDTIEDLVGAWTDYLNSKYGTSVYPEDIVEWSITQFFPSLTKEQVFEPLYLDEFWYTVKPKEGAADVLQRLKADGHTIMIVTSSSFKTLRTKMEAVLFKYFPFISWDDVIVTTRKQLIKGDVLIDDGIHNLEGGDYVKLLMDAPHNRHCDVRSKGIVRVHDWNDVYKVINGMTN